MNVSAPTIFGPKLKPKSAAYTRVFTVCCAVTVVFLTLKVVNKKFYRVTILMNATSSTSMLDHSMADTIPLAFVTCSIQVYMAKDQHIHETRVTLM